MKVDTRFALAALLLASAACSRGPSPSPAAPAPAAPTPGAPAAAPTPAATPSVPANTPPAPPATGTADLSGEWGWSVDIGGQAVSGTMTLTRSGTTYGGSVVPDGMTPATVRTVTIVGDRVTIMIDTPDGEATVEATLSADRRALSGTLAFNGMTGQFNGRRR